MRKGFDKRNWVFTLHFTDKMKEISQTETLVQFGDWLMSQMDASKILNFTYIHYGEEYGSTGETPHLQGYFQLEIGAYLAVIKSELNCKQMYLMGQRAKKCRDADNYTIKEGHHQWQVGQRDDSSDSFDLKDLCEKLYSGKITLREIQKNEPQMYLQYAKKFREFLSTCPQVVIHGPARLHAIPKSQINDYIHTDSDPYGEDCFVYSGSWQGYDGQQRVVIFEDPKVNIDSLLLPRAYVNSGYERLPFTAQDIYLIQIECVDQWGIRQYA